MSWIHEISVFELQIEMKHEEMILAVIKHDLNSNQRKAWIFQAFLSLPLK